jgi:hypothetical protein
MPGPVKMCTAIYLVLVWVSFIFFAAADLVMILRVYAMWNQSKRVFYILLFMYVAQVILSFVARDIYSPNTTYLSVTVVQIMDFSFCNISFNDAPSPLLLGATALQFVFSVMLFILAVIPTLKESVVLYKATRQWQPNNYMQQLMQDGILYFLANIINNITLAWLQNDITLNSTSQLVLVFLNYTTVCPIMPRFIISVRELYDRSLRGRGHGIDTGFGVSSQPGNADISAIEFADVTPGQEQGRVAEGEVGDSEAIRLDELGDGTRSNLNGDFFA